VTPAERRRRAVLAGHRGDEATARDALADDEVTVRIAALGALERLGVLDDDLLAAGLTDPAPTVRRRAAELAATHPGVSLLDALDDPDERVIEMAAFSCGEHERPTPAVVSRLSALGRDHPDALVREAAVAALGAIGAPDGLATILYAADRDWQVRQVAEDLDAP